MRVIPYALFCILASLNCAAQSAKEYLAMANKAYDAGSKEKAKQFYERAASLKDPEAHYALAYKYIVNKGEAIHHYSEAAKMGHSEATSEALEWLFFRAESLTMANPKLAYDIYLQAKKQNPYLDLFDEASKVETLKQCIEAGPFDAKEFIRKYNITDKDTVSNYAIWELATEASRNGRFGPPNPKLVLQLVCQGGLVPAEVMYAVADVHKNWKYSRNVTFEPCDYLASGIGLAYCSEIASREAEIEYSTIVRNTATKLKNNAGSLLRPAYYAASQFIEEKAFLEEGHDGTGYMAWARTSVDTQKAEFLDLVKKINAGYIPKLPAEVNYDKQLNETYQKVIARLKKVSIETGFRTVTDHNIVMVQRKWIKYRDAAGKLFAQISPSLTEAQWKDYLTDIRTRQLKDIESLR